MPHYSYVRTPDTSEYTRRRKRDTVKCDVYNYQITTCQELCIEKDVLFEDINFSANLPKEELPVDQVNVIRITVNECDLELPKRTHDKFYGCRNVLVLVRFTAEDHIRWYIKNILTPVLSKHYTLDSLYRWDKFRTKGVTIANSKNFLFSCFEDEDVTNGCYEQMTGNTRGAGVTRRPFNRLSCARHCHDLNQESFLALSNWLGSSNECYRFLRHIPLDRIVRGTRKPEGKALIEHFNVQSDMCSGNHEPTQVSKLPTFPKQTGSTHRVHNRSVTRVPFDHCEMGNPVWIIKIKDYPECVIEHVGTTHIPPKIVLEIWLEEFASSYSLIYTYLHSIHEWPSDVLDNMRCLDAARGLLYYKGNIDLSRVSGVKHLKKRSKLLSTTDHLVVSFPGIQWSCCIKKDGSKIVMAPKPPRLQARMLPTAVRDFILEHVCVKDPRWMDCRIPFELLVPAMAKTTWIAKTHQDMFVKALGKTNTIYKKEDTLREYHNPTSERLDVESAQCHHDEMLEYLQENYSDARGRILLGRSRDVNGQPHSPCLWDLEVAYVTGLTKCYKAVTDGALEWVSTTLFLQDRL
uniref:ORF1 n=1 Tax=Malaco herpesvirus 4 TaxID=3031800 RepID=A0AA48SEZ7_9VIRU|nr:TPA_asm: ORF1 [Malaco herpesvirus 4]